MLTTACAANCVSCNSLLALPNTMFFQLTMDIETKWLRDFLMLAQTRNFSTAAQLRHVTQSAFSRRIQALEKSLGVTLVDRRTQPLTLTLQGEQFVPTAAMVISSLQNSAVHLRSLSDKKNLTIAATHTLALGIFPRVLQQINRQLPNLTTELKVADADDCIHWLTTEQVHYLLAFHDKEKVHKDFESFALCKVSLIPVYSPNLAERLSESEPLPYLAYQPNIYLGRVVTRHLQHGINRELMRITSAPMADSLKMLAMQGLGFAWLPDFAIAQELASGALLQVPNLKVIDDLEVRLYRNVNQQQVVDWLEIQNLF